MQTEPRSSARRNVRIFAILASVAIVCVFLLARLAEEDVRSQTHSRILDTGASAGGDMLPSPGGASETAMEPRSEGPVRKGGESDTLPASVSDQSGKSGESLAVHTTDSANRTITVENVGLYFLAETDKARADLNDAIESQSHDLSASNQTVASINSVLMQFDIGDLASDWQIDCRVTICIAAIEGTSLQDLDEQPVHAMFEALGFEKILWYRDYRQETTTVFMLRPGFEYDRSASQDDQPE